MSGLRHEVDEQVGDTDLRDQVNEDGRHPEDQIAVPPQRVIFCVPAGPLPVPSPLRAAESALMMIASRTNTPATIA